jgi:hypothetical protein
MAEYLRTQQGKLVEYERTVTVRIPDGLTAEDVLDSVLAFQRLWGDDCGEWHRCNSELICDKPTQVIQEPCECAVELSAQDIAAIKEELSYREVQDGH